MPWLIILEIYKEHSISLLLVGVILSSTHLRQCFYQCTVRICCFIAFPPKQIGYSVLKDASICTLGCDSEFVQSDDKCGGRAAVDINTNGRGLDYY